jgi:hypothetical protein
MAMRADERLGCRGRSGNRLSIARTGPRALCSRGKQRMGMAQLRLWQVCSSFTIARIGTDDVAASDARADSHGTGEVR